MSILRMRSSYRTRRGADARPQAGPEDVIGYLRDRGITLTYDLAEGPCRQAPPRPSSGRQANPARRAPYRKEEEKTAGRPARAQARASVTSQPAAKRRALGFTVSEGDLNAKAGAISPDRGNHAAYDTQLHAGDVSPVSRKRRHGYRYVGHPPRCRLPRAASLPVMGAGCCGRDIRRSALSPNRKARQLRRTDQVDLA
jgi:hypothetical protein